MKLLTIIIATLDRHRDLSVCLDSIIENIPYCYHKDIDVIVVDQSDCLFNAEKYINSTLKVSLLRHDKGASISRNYGATVSNSKYVWFFDDDAILKTINIDKLSTNEDCYFLEWFEKPFNKLPDWLFNRINLLRKSGTPFYIIRRELFCKINGFNKQYGPGTQIIACEDMDLLLRATKVIPLKVETIVGVVSHPLSEIPTPKNDGYAYARGYVLSANREIALIIAELVFSMLNILKRPKRLANVINGIKDGYKFSR